MELKRPKAHSPNSQHVVRFFEVRLTARTSIVPESHKPKSLTGPAGGGGRCSVVRDAAGWVELCNPFRVVIDKGTMKADEKPPGHVHRSEQQLHTRRASTAVTEFQPIIRRRGRSIRREYRKYHPVYRMEGGVGLVVLFLIVVVVSVFDQWDSTQVLFVVFDIFPSLALWHSCLVICQSNV